MAFSTRYLGEYRTALYADLADTGSALWTTAQIDRCVERAVSDLNRHYPLEVAYEHTIDYTITDEVSAAPVAGTWKALTYKPIRPDSEVVTNSTGTTTYTKDTDYIMDYINGKYTIISGGSITATASLLVDYQKSLLGIDLSAIITNMLRIVRVETPGNAVPQQFVNYSIWNNFMYIGSLGQAKSQAELQDSDHVVIYYEAPHTAPTTTAAPTYPAFLDDVICIGAGGYAMLIKAAQYEHQAVTDIASMRTELGYTTAVHTLLNIALDAAISQAVLAATALGKVATYLETYGTTTNARSSMVAITGALHSDVVTAAKHADAVLTQLAGASVTELSTTLSVTESDLNAIYTEQKKFLITSGGYDGAIAQTLLAAGDDYINAVNLGSRVAELYNEYAVTAARLADIAGQVGSWLASLDHAEAGRLAAIANSQSAVVQNQSAIASSMGAVASSLGAAAAAANALIENNRSYIEEATGWVAIANAFVNEAQARVATANEYLGEAQTEIAEIDRYLAEADRYRQAVESDMTLSDRFRVEGQQRLVEFNKVLESRTQYRKRLASVPVSQPS